MKREYWHESEGFPKRSFYHLRGKNKGLDKNLFHAKIIIVNDRENEKEITDDTVFYFGSHNFSAGAWGNLEKDGT